MKDVNPYHLIAGFCIPINVFILLMSISIGDGFGVLLAIFSSALVLLPILKERSSEEEKKKDAKQIKKD